MVAQPWPATYDLGALLDLEPRMRAAVTGLLPHVPQVILDLGLLAEDKLLGWPLSALGKLALLCLKHGRFEKDPLERFAGWMPLCGQILRSRTAAPALASVLRYILRVNRYVTLEAIERLLVQHLGEKGRETMATAGEKLIEQGRIKGRAEGQAEGQLDGQRQALLRLLRTKFGAVPDKVASRVMKASPDQLLTWLDRILSAARLRDVFTLR